MRSFCVQGGRGGQKGSKLCVHTNSIFPYSGLGKTRIILNKGDLLRDKGSLLLRKTLPSLNFRAQRSEIHRSSRNVFVFNLTFDASKIEVLGFGKFWTFWADSHPWSKIWTVLLSCHSLNVKYEGPVFGVRAPAGVPEGPDEERLRRVGDLRKSHERHHRSPFRRRLRVSRSLSTSQVCSIARKITF